MGSILAVAGLILRRFINSGLHLDGLGLDGFDLSGFRQGVFGKMSEPKVW